MTDHDALCESEFVSGPMAHTPCRCDERSDGTRECGECALEAQHDGPCWWPGMNMAIACCVEFARAGQDHEDPCTYLDGRDE